MKPEFKDTSGITMVMGFAMVMVLMLALGFVGLTRIANIYWHMEQIVKDRNVKTKLAQVMNDALRERAVLMHSISILDDPFDQDAEFLEFNEKGAEYVNARHSLENMLLNEGEKTILFRIQSQTQVTQPLVNSAINVALSGDMVRAQALIREQAIPRVLQKCAPVDVWPGCCCYWTWFADCFSGDT
jgi:Four helix bundle sensory module for signal transduction